MDAADKLNVLIDELESFVDYESQAIKDANWEYFKEVGQKKQRHLAKVAELAGQVDIDATGVRERLEALRDAQKANGDLIAESMDENQQQQGELAVAKGRVAKVRNYLNQQKADSRSKLNKDA